MTIKNLFDNEFEFLRKAIQTILVLNFGQGLPDKQLDYLSLLYWNHLTRVKHLSSTSLIRLNKNVGKYLQKKDISNYIGILKSDGLIQYDPKTKIIQFPLQLTRNIKSLQNLTIYGQIHFGAEKEKSKTSDLS